MAPPAVGEVHLWLLDLDAHAAPAIDATLLSAHERERAARFVFEQHRQRFLTHRAWLRRVLARYLDRDPATLAFDLLANDKPRLHGHAAELEFNLSHSGPLALLAVARGTSLGVDVEQRREVARPLEIAERHFGPREYAWVAADEGATTARFFTCWTRKEAFIKATGEGLSRALTSFDVRPEEAGPVRVLERGGDGAPWYVLDLNPRPDAAAALCSRLAAPRLHWASPPPGLDPALRPAMR